MVGPPRSNTSQDPPDPSGHERPVARGFGEFSGAHRARWALSHPDVQRPWPADVDSESQRRAYPSTQRARTNGPALKRAAATRRRAISTGRGQA